MDKSYCSSTLLVRHLPAELSDDDKKELLFHFGAKSVKPMGTSGPMKHTAFANFDKQESAERCLKRLHQQEVLGRKLVVEFARTDQSNHFPSDATSEKPVKQKADDREGLESEKKDLEHQQNQQSSNDDVFAKHSIQYPRKPNLYYLYPPPTVSTLTNIANALASHPRFYTQVLHLMNKMNLPCPFGAVTATPPIALDADVSMRNIKNVMQRNEVTAGEIAEIEMEQDSTEESELDSEEDEKQRKGKNVGLGNSGNKANVRPKAKQPRKRMKLVQPDMSTIIRPVITQKPSEVFEHAEELKTKPIMLNLTGAQVMTQSHSRAETNVDLTHPVSGASVELNINQSRKTDQSVTVVEGGFGKVEPQSKQTDQEEMQKPDVNYKLDPKQFFSKDSVASGRLRKEQFKDFSVFKNYKSGECTSRLYIKNLTKQSSEQDLVNIFGSFIDWSVELAYETFDIRLMREGRMKGQAFVTLPDEKSAQNIVSECNGYILNNKPMVIQFARSAKAKEVDKPVSAE